MRFFIFDLVSFLFRFTLSFNKKHALFDFERHTSFQNQNNRKTTGTFTPRPLIFSLQ